MAYPSQVGRAHTAARHPGRFWMLVVIVDKGDKREYAVFNLSTGAIHAQDPGIHHRPPAKGDGGRGSPLLRYRRDSGCPSLCSRTGSVRTGTHRVGRTPAVHGNPDRSGDGEIGRAHV